MEPCYFKEGFDYNPSFVSNNYNSDRMEMEHCFNAFNYTDNQEFSPNFDQSPNKLQNLNMNLKIIKESNNKKLIESESNMRIEIELINENKFSKSCSIMNQYKFIEIKNDCINNEINFETLETLISSLVLSCTKDNICSAKNWIIEQSNKGSNATNCVLEYMKYRVFIAETFNEKLHILYLMNDLLHYSKRKQSDIITSLEKYVTPMYLMCTKDIVDDNKSKLNKVLSLWETNSYLNCDVINSLKSLQNDSSNYLFNIISEEIKMYKSKEDFGQVEIEENANSITHVFSDALMKIQNLESNHNQLRHEMKLKEESLEVEIYHLERSLDMNKSMPGINDAMMKSMFEPHSVPFQMPDITQPPPGFTDLPPVMFFDNSTEIPLAESVPEISNDESVKTLPYWKLPSAVMLINLRLDDYDYEPIDSDNMELPHLKKPSRRLLDNVNKFYSPSADVTRDTEGWEVGKLQKYYNLKEKAKNKQIVNDLLRDFHNKNNEDEEFIEDQQVEPEIMQVSSNTNALMHPLTDRASSRPNPISNPQRTNTRSLLGNPWDSQVADYYEPIPPNYNNRPPATNNTRNFPTRVTPLMSLDLSNEFSHDSGQRRGIMKRGGTDRRKSRSYESRSVSESHSRSNSSYSRSKSRSLSGTRSRSSSKSSSTRRFSPSRERYSRSYSKSRSSSPISNNFHDK